jgi:hypothetical protein
MGEHREGGQEIAKGVKGQDKQGKEVRERHLPLHKGVVVVIMRSSSPSSRGCCRYHRVFGVVCG